MAICEDCKQEMLTASGCTKETLERDGRMVQRLRYTGRFTPWERTGPIRERCPDCGVRPGGLHHHGCDIERCPTCRGQCIACECNYPDEPVDEIDEQIRVATRLH